MGDVEGFSGDILSFHHLAGLARFRDLKESGSALATK